MTWDNVVAEILQVCKWVCEQELVCQCQVCLATVCIYEKTKRKSLSVIIIHKYTYENTCSFILWIRNEDSLYFSIAMLSWEYLVNLWLRQIVIHWDGCYVMTLVWNLCVCLCVCDSIIWERILWSHWYFTQRWKCVPDGSLFVYSPLTKCNSTQIYK